MKAMLLRWLVNLLLNWLVSKPVAEKVKSLVKEAETAYSENGLRKSFVLRHLDKLPELNSKSVMNLATELAVQLVKKL